MPVDFRRRVLTSEFLDPRQGYQPFNGSVEVRWDPLTGHACRLVAGSLLTPSDVDLAELAERTRESCFFCGDRVEQVTPRLPPALHPEGRIRHGRAVLFPNLMTYSQHSAVSVYGPDLHFLPLDAMTPAIVAGNLGAQARYVAAVQRFDAEAVWASVNANHMLPSGSSLFHPHMQSSVDPVPSTMQALLAAVPGSDVDDYLEAERRSGERWIGSTGRVRWLAAFAPAGFDDVRAVVPGVSSPGQLDDDLVDELATGISRVLGVYAERGRQSFNLALFGIAAQHSSHPLTLRIVARANLQTLYRSDVTYFERLHLQAMVDGTPEELAERARGRFAG